MRRALRAIDLDDLLIGLGLGMAAAAGWAVSPLLLVMVVGLLLCIIGLVRAR